MIRVLLALILATGAALAAPPQPAPVPQSRTYLTPTGSDSNGCTVSAPCRTLQAAVNMTLAGGEVFVLDSGAFGGATITKAIAITSEGAAAGTGSIVISASASDDIHLRGIDLDGANSASTGVQFNSGRSLIISKSAVRNFTGTGISAAAGSVFIHDTTISGNGNNGIALSGTASGVIDRVRALGNGGAGIFASGVPATIVNTLVSGNNFGIAAANNAVMVRNSTSINNIGAGLRSDAATVRFSGSNITGLQALNGGTLQSYGNNVVQGGSPTGTLALQ